jgi:hypothetical protein
MKQAFLVTGSSVSSKMSIHQREAAIGMYALNGEEEGEFYGKFKAF